TARRLRMRLSLLPLLRQRLVVDRVVVDEPVVRLVCDRAGRLNVATLGGRARRANAAPSPAAHHGPAFQLGALRLRHGTVRYTDRATGRSLELTEVAVDAREPRFGAPMPRGVPHVAGALELDAALGGPAPGVEGFRNALAGSGGFRVADGRVTGVGVGAAVLDVLRPVIGSGTADRLRSRYPDLLGSDDLRFTKLSGTGRL